MVSGDSGSVCHAGTGVVAGDHAGRLNMDVDLALAVPRVAVGTFFAVSGTHKLLVKERQWMLVKTLMSNHVPLVGINRLFVPSCELAAGVCLTLGLLSVPAAAILACIMVVACVCEASEKVARYKPLNAADRLDDYLYLPEVLYLVLLSVTLIGGAGAYSLDHLFFN